MRMHVCPQNIRKMIIFLMGIIFLNINHARGRGKSVRDLGGFKMKEILPQDETIHPVEST